MFAHSREEEQVYPKGPKDNLACITVRSKGAKQRYILTAEYLGYQRANCRGHARVKGPLDTKCYTTNYPFPRIIVAMILDDSSN